MTRKPDQVIRELRDIAEALRRFAAERNWEQFHSPKNLAAALTVEAAELLEQFQWLTEKQSSNLPENELAAVAEEIADVQMYLVQLADKLGIDIARAVTHKLQKNATKYPVEVAFGSAKKRPEQGDSKP